MILIQSNFENAAVEPYTEVMFLNRVPDQGLKCFKQEVAWRKRKNLQVIL